MDESPPAPAPTPTARTTPSTGAAAQPTSGGAVRGGRGAIVAAAREALATADLEALISFLGPRPLARAAGLSPGTVTHHFANAREVAIAVLQDALEEFLPPDVPAMLLDALSQLGSDHDTMFDLIRAAATLDFTHSTSMVAANSALYLSCIVSPNDPEIAALVRSHYDRFRPEMGKVYAEFARGIGRRFDSEHGFDPESMVTLFALITDGFLVLHRFDPERADRDLYVETVLRLFDAVTIPLDDPPVAVQQRLVANVPLEAARLGESPAQLFERAVEVAAGLYTTDGWDRLRHQEIALRMGVRPASVAGLTHGRPGLADVVWRRLFLADVVDCFEQAIDGPERPSIAAIHAFQYRLVEITHSHPRLTGAMLGHLVDEAARGAGVETTDRTPLYDVLAGHLAPAYAAHLIHGIITGALFDRGPTAQVAERLIQGYEKIRTATQ